MISFFLDDILIEMCLSWLTCEQCALVGKKGFLLVKQGVQYLECEKKKSRWNSNDHLPKINEELLSALIILIFFLPVKTFACLLFPMFLDIGKI